MSEQPAEAGKPKYRIVMPEQYQQGYFQMRNGIVYHMNFAPLKKLEDGCWVVLEPTDQGENWQSSPVTPPDALREARK